MERKRILTAAGWMLCTLCVFPGLSARGFAEEAAAKETEAPPLPPVPVVAPAARVFAHPFGGPGFETLIADSAKVTGYPGTEAFHTWMDEAALRAARFYPLGKGAVSWTELLNRHRTDLEGTEGKAERAAKEMALGVWLHATIKKAIPNYSLDRGFELANIPRREERQCLMQSLLISSLLQAMGVDAGIAMVNRNREGEYVNNSHVIVLLKLSNGHDAIVDASYREPLVAHEGIMAMLAGVSYRYARPVYSEDYREIVSYTLAPSGEPVSTEKVRPMDLAFVRSQLDYFRGERTTGGVLARDNTPAGLERSIRFFQSSLKECARNPLPSYMLGQVYEKQGHVPEANAQYRLARDLYTLAGWVPSEVSRAIGRTRIGH